MTADEVRVCFEKDVYSNEKYHAFCKNKLAEFNKVQKKAPQNKPCARVYQYVVKESNQKYYFVLMIRSGWGDNKLHSLMLADVDGGEKGKLFILEEKGRNVCHALKVHFLNRHNERLGFHDGTTLQKLARYLIHGYLYSSFWYEEEEKRYVRNVCACKDGLVLCEMDTKCGFLYFNTFVSKEMLKGTQREAFNEIVTDYYEEESHEVYRTFRKSRKEGLDMLNANSILRSDKRKIAREIYDQYFE